MTFDLLRWSDGGRVRALVLLRLEAGAAAVNVSDELISPSSSGGFDLVPSQSAARAKCPSARETSRR